MFVKSYSCLCNYTFALKTRSQLNQKLGYYFPKTHIYYLCYGNRFVYIDMYLLVKLAPNHVKSPDLGCMYTKDI